jgi:hypothetical protein
MDGQRLAHFLEISKLVFKESLHQYLLSFLQLAKPDELKGLQVFHSVIKHKGRKRFRPTSNSRPTFSSTEKDLRTKTMMSFYTVDFCAQQREKQQHAEILRYRTLSQLAYAELLSREALVYGEKWIALGDEPKFQHYMLECLKGFACVIKIQSEVRMSTKQEDYSMTPLVRPVKVQHEIRGNRRGVATSQEVNRRRTESRREKEEDRSGKIFYEPSYYQDRMKKIMRGTGNILKWVHEKNISSYQDNYYTKGMGNTQPVKPFKSSTVVKLMP